MVCFYSAGERCGILQTDSVTKNKINFQTNSEKVYTTPEELNLLVQRLLSISQSLTLWKEVIQMAYYTFKYSCRLPSFFSQKRASDEEGRRRIFIN